MRHTSSRLAVLALTGALALTACGGGSAGPAAGQAAPTPSSTAATTVSPTTTSPSPSPSAATTATTTTAPPAAATKVSANNATRAELQKAFEAAGISNAASWAREVEEYRPYPTNDPTIAKLRQNLAKYNPAPGVVDQIVATLSL